jgi:hypothetical protein
VNPRKTHGGKTTCDHVAAVHRHISFQAGKGKATIRGTRRLKACNPLVRAGEGMLGGHGPQALALATGCQQEWGKGVEWCRVCVPSYKDGQAVLPRGGRRCL